MLLSLIWLAIFFKGFNVESLRMEHLARLCLSAMATTVSHCSPHSSSSTPSPSRQGNNYKPPNKATTTNQPQNLTTTKLFAVVGFWG